MRNGSFEVAEQETLFLVEHNNSPMYRMPGRTQKEYWDECRMVILEMGNYYPTWKIVSSVVPKSPDQGRTVEMKGKARVS